MSAPARSSRPSTAVTQAGNKRALTHPVGQVWLHGFFDRALLAEPAGRLAPQDQIALSFDPDARLDPVEGQPPDLTRLDAGCSFRPRRRFAIAACDARPTLEPAGDPAH